MKKTTSNAHKQVSTFAFRNGTDRVSTCVSSIHRNHHWEAIALCTKEANCYNENNNYFKNKCNFARLESRYFGAELIEEQILIEDLDVNVITLRQCKCKKE